MPAAGGPSPDLGVAEVLAAARRALVSAGTPDEALAELVQPRALLGFARAPRMRPLGRVWRLGVLLLDADGGLHATGRITRAVPPGHPGHVAVSQEQRREVRAAAFRGPFAAGETVNYDTVPLDPAGPPADGPLLLRDGALLVRWSQSAGDDAARPFAAYVTERTALLLDPPRGAT